MKPNEPLRVQRGSAIFLAPQYDMWTLRQATRRAILTGQAAQDFVVVESTMYYPNMLDNVLGFEVRRDSIAASYGDRIVGETDGAGAARICTNRAGKGCCCTGKATGSCAHMCRC